MLKSHLSRLGFVLLTLASTHGPVVRAAAVTYNFSYSGRLTEANGRPVQGPVALSLSFYRQAIGGTSQLTVTEGLSAVPLQEGIFQVSLALSGSDFHQAFPSVLESVYVEITDLTNRADKPYERQLVAMVPYAAKIPVDDKTVTFDSQGRATLAVSGTASSGKLLSADGSGGLAWIDQPSASVSAVGGVSAANVATGATAANAASSLATASTIVKRDSNGGFSADNVLVSPTSAVRQGLIVKGATAQSASLQEWQDTNGAVLTAIDPSGALKFKDSDGTANYVGLKGPAAAASNVTYTLPAAPVAGYYLQTDASGVMSWASPSGSGDMNTSTYDINANGIVDTSEDGQKFVNGSGWAGSAPTTQTTLGVNLAAGATTATVADTASYPSAGLLLIDSEVISYSGKTGTTFTGLTRGLYGTTDALHTSPASVGNFLFSAAASSAAAKMVVTGQGRMGLGTVKPGAVIEAVSPSNLVTQINRGAAGQTFDLQQWQANDGTILSAINKDGGLELKGSDTANYVALKAGAGMSGNLSLTLPSAQGAANSLLTNNGAGVLSWSTAAIPASGTLSTLAGTETLTNKTLTAPTITAAASVGVRDSSAAFDVNVAATSSTALSAARTLTVDVDNGSRTLALKKNLTVDTGNVTLTGQAGGSSVTLPPSGTLATLAGTETLTNKTLTSPTINGGTMNSALGAVGTPSYSFTSDLDTGIWSSGANTVNLSTGGSERLRVDSNGNVGIGTTSPTAKLTVNGAAEILAGNTLSFYRPDNAVAGTISVNASNTMLLSSASGIATSSVQLGSGGSVYGDGATVYSNTGNPVTLKSNISNAANSYNVVVDTVAPATATKLFAIRNNGSEKVTVDAAGNVGIGTAAPAYPLQVVGSIGVESNGSVSFSGSQSLGRSVGGDFYIDSPQNTSVIFSRDSRAKTGFKIQFGQGAQTDQLFADAMSDVNNDNFGLTKSGLHLGVNSGVTPMVTWKAASWYNAADVALSRSAAGLLEVNSGTQGQYRDIQLRAINPTSGNVGIGTTTPTSALHVKTQSATALTGTVSVAAGDNDVSGSGTAFLSEIQAGDAIRIGSQTLTVIYVADNENLILDANHTAGASNVTATLDGSPFRIETSAGTTRMAINKTGLLGLGTSTPVRSLHIVSSRSQWSGADGIVLEALTGSNTTPQIEFRNNAGAAKGYLGMVSAAGGSVNGGAHGDMFLRSENNNSIHLTADGGLTSHVTVKSSGNVGIGTPTPEATLHISGTLKLSSNSSAPFVCDVAAEDGVIARTSLHTLCMCNDGLDKWVSIVDGTTDCTWQ